MVFGLQGLSSDEESWEWPDKVEATVERMIVNIVDKFGKQYTNVKIVKLRSLPSLRSDILFSRRCYRSQG